MEQYLQNRENNTKKAMAWDNYVYDSDFAMDDGIYRLFPKTVGILWAASAILFVYKLALGGC